MEDSSSNNESFSLDAMRQQDSTDGFTANQTIKTLLYLITLCRSNSILRVHPVFKRGQRSAKSHASTFIGMNRHLCWTNQSRCDRERSARFEKTISKRVYSREGACSSLQELESELQITARRIILSDGNYRVGVRGERDKRIRFICRLRMASRTIRCTVFG